MGTDLVVALAALAVIATGVSCLEVRRNRTDRAARDRCFDAVLAVLGDPHLRTRPHQYPVLTGWHRGHPVRVEAIVDTLTVRKLPILWMFVTVHRPLGFDSPIDVLARPIGTEFFSPNASFGHQVPTPADFPVHARIATARAMALDATTLDTFHELMRDPRVKEVQAGPAGARIVFQLAEAAQGPYRTGRRAEFGAPRLEPRTLTDLLDGLAQLAEVSPPERVRTP